MKHSFFATEVLEDTIDEDFRLELLELCNQLLEGRDPSRLVTGTVGRTTFQSTSAIREQLLAHPAIVRLYEELKTKYVPKLFEDRGPVHPLTKTFLSRKYDNDEYFDPEKWHVFFTDMEPGRNMDKHLHTGNPISGIIYLECADDVPPLTLYEPRPWAQILEHYNGMPREVHLDADQGKILLWDSFGLQHGVSQMNSQGPRKTLVFGL